MARSESTENKLAKDPIENAENAEPTEPKDMNDPTDPMDNIEPLEQMQRIESCDRIDHREEESEDTARSSHRSAPDTRVSSLAEVMTPQEEREAAMIAYNAARVDFEAAQERWDALLAITGAIESDSTEAGAAFERLKEANAARQDALDSLWLAWRNRPDAE